MLKYCSKLSQHYLILMPYFTEFCNSRLGKFENHNGPLSGFGCVDIFMCPRFLRWFFCFFFLAQFCFRTFFEVSRRSSEQNMLSCTEAPNGIQMHNCCRPSDVGTALPSWQRFFSPHRVCTSLLLILVMLRLWMWCQTLRKYRVNRVILCIYYIQYWILSFIFV